ncbi:hypothetical protein, partial [Endozoicomonas sp. ONNA2]|uniref:hypothetical protein n=1 Tax=Endozoicomonas sp. ONNA2 TaxID=2828741 RepID=UPI00214743F2
MINYPSFTASSPVNDPPPPYDDPPPSYEETMAQRAVLGDHEVQSASADATVNLNVQTTTPIQPGTPQEANIEERTVGAVSVAGAVSVTGAVSVNSGNTQLLRRLCTDNSELEPHFEATLDSALVAIIAKFPNIVSFFRVPDFKSAAAKMLALYAYYSLPDYDDSQEPKRESKKALCELVLNNTKPFNIVFPYIAVPGCGHFKPERFLDVVLSLCESAYQGTFPKKVISIGSGQAFLEKCLSLMGDVTVKCYDREPLTRFLPVEHAEFPKDINNCLPDDCRDCLLVSGYPQGFLGPVLLEFIRRGGEMLC